MKLFNAKLALAILAMASGFVVSSSTHDGQPRRELFPSNSIAQEMSNEHSKGNSNPRFTLTAGLVAASNNSNLFGGTTQGSSSSFSVNVREPVQAVTKDTTYSEYDGRHELVGELDHTILVADMDAEEDGTVALISVNKVTEEVNGIVHKGGRKMKFTQKKGKKVGAVCTVSKDIHWHMSSDSLLHRSCSSSAGKRLRCTRICSTSMGMRCRSRPRKRRTTFSRGNVR